MIGEPLNFDIDRYINPYIPYSRLHLLPRPLSRFLGFRHGPAPKIGNVMAWWWAFIGAFSGLLVVEAVFRTERMQLEGVPIVIASLGATAILEYNAIDSPLAQPRNAILGQVFSAIIGIGITKLFHYSPHFESLRFVSGALSVGVASAFMSVTKTVHPPGGATALLCSTEPAITALGWLFLPIITLGAAILISVALLLNNIQRQFPVYWWTPTDLRPQKVDDIAEKGEARTAESRTSDSETCDVTEERISIDLRNITLPDWIELDYEEKAMLELLQARLRQGHKPIDLATIRSASTV